MCRFWRDFCQTATKIPGFFVAGAKYNLESLGQYIATQAASSLKTYLRIHDGDLTGLPEMVTAAQYNNKQKQLLEEYAIPLKSLSTSTSRSLPARENLCKLLLEQASIVPDQRAVDSKINKGSEPLAAGQLFDGSFPRVVYAKIKLQQRSTKNTAPGPS